MIEWMEEEASGDIIKWTVDLKSMKETDGKVTKEVQRRTIAERGMNFRGLLYRTNILKMNPKQYKLFCVFLKGATMDLPKNWTTGPTAGTYTLVQLATTDLEFATVSQEFQRTCPRQIVKVCKHPQYLSVQF